MEKSQLHNERERKSTLEEILPNEKNEKDWRYTQFTFHAKGSDVISLVKKLLGQANVFKITVYHGKRPLISIPIIYGGAAAAIFPLMSIFSMISLLALNCSIVIDKNQADNG